MSYRVAICDDSSRDAEYVLSILNAWADINQISVKTEHFPSAESLLFHYAAYQKSSKTLILKKSVVSKKSALKTMLKDAKEQKESGFWSTGDAEHSVRHEIGHAIDFAYVRNKGILNNPKADAITMMCQKVTDECGITRWSLADFEHQPAAGGKISYYALMDDKEFVAESVAEYMAGKPRDIAKQVIDILLKDG